MDLVLHAIRRWCRSNWPLVLAGLLVVYFAFHALHGPRGAFAWLDLRREIDASQGELAVLEERERALTLKVDALRPEAVDPDLLEEELRKLGYIGEREVLILDDASPADGTLPK